MTSQTQTPLVGPLRRRGPRAILRFEPLTRDAHAALVVTRRGRLLGVIPAGGRRTLSDYLDWPYEVREVDMRERLLSIVQQCESAEAGYNFALTMQVTYRVTRPERVALEHMDVLAELEQAIAQRARAIAATLGIEQTSALKDYLLEALTSGNELPARFTALGLAFCRADIAVELGADERVRADALREQTRDRPLLARLRTESLDPSRTFDVQVGGFYRVRTRAADAPAFAEVEETIRALLTTALDRVGMAYAPADYRTAAEAMTDALWNDGVLKAELAAAGIELLRPAVHIYPDREDLGQPFLLEDSHMHIRRLRPRLAIAPPPDAQDGAAGAPFDESLAEEGDTDRTVEGELVHPEEEGARPPSGGWPGDWRGLVGELRGDSDGASWWVDEEGTPGDQVSLAAEAGGLPADAVADSPAATAGEEEAASEEMSAGVLVAGPAREEVATMGEDGRWTHDAADSLAAASGEKVAPSPEEVAAVLPVDALEPGEPAAEDAAGSPVEAADTTLAAGNSPEATVAPDAARDGEHAAGAAPDAVRDAQGDPSAHAPEQAVIEGWVRLLQAGGRAQLKLWTLELSEAPARLPEILGPLTADPAVLAHAGDPAHQRALVQALGGAVRQEPAPPSPTPPQAHTDDDVPDWLQLRASVQQGRGTDAGRSGGAA
ncbi:MAG TPA: hypothetical protein VNL77_07700 [Roseiflexaceae bacterium]|nr:hypothetical protein [Roseiflexaceae bacterium]